MTAEPKSGCISTNINIIKAYKPEIIICLILAISICLLEKYFANTIINTNFIISAGWNENRPKSSQLNAPWDILPMKKSDTSNIHEKRNSVTETHVLRRNRKSTKHREKNTIIENIDQINCLMKN